MSETKFGKLFESMRRRQKAAEIVKPKVEEVSQTREEHMKAESAKERSRIKGIMTLSEARANPVLAEYLSYKTDCTLENAITILGWGK
jgi:hypothetical protein